MSLREAVHRHVRPGMHLHLAYGGGRPNAAIAEVIRQFCDEAPGFTVSAHGFVNSQHALVAKGLVSHLIVAFAGENYPSPRPNKILQRAVHEQRVTLENWSIGSLTARLIAGALGVEFMPVRALTGSSMAEEHAGTTYFELSALPGDETQPVVRALRPDLTFVHGIAADRHGNVLLPAPFGEGAWGAIAAREGVIATVETILDDEAFAARNTLPLIPSYAVRSVSVAPRGAHPYGMSCLGVPGVANYREDDAFMEGFRHASHSESETLAWVQEWMLDPRDHRGFLEKLDQFRREKPTRESHNGMAAQSRPRTLATAVTEQPVAASDDERMTLVAARLIRDRIKEAGTNVVLAGIGNAHLAAWTAVTPLGISGAHVSIAAELGMFGVHPAAGDPYLFSQQNLPTTTALVDVLSVLGRDVSGPTSTSLAVLGAGEVDKQGNLNSTWSGNGDFILGSGGANDVATGADDVIVVVRHSPSRLVDNVRYITAPGARVSAIVTTEAVLERRGGRFEVTRYLKGDDAETAVERIRNGMAWTAPFANDFAREPEVEAADLTLLRSFDPHSVFAGRRNC